MHIIVFYLVLTEHFKIIYIKKAISFRRSGTLKKLYKTWYVFLLIYLCILLLISNDVYDFLRSIEKFITISVLVLYEINKDHAVKIIRDKSLNSKKSQSNSPKLWNCGGKKLLLYIYDVRSNFLCLKRVFFFLSK